MEGPTDKDLSTAKPGRRELLVIFGFAIIIFGLVATGGAICAVTPSPSPWITAAAYGGPASLAFGLYWLVARRPPW